MKLHSPYLNPFQSLPERGIEEPDEPISAIENNMSRALFSALANAEEMDGLTTILRELAQHKDSRGSTELKDRIEILASAIREVDPNTVEVGLQGWPTCALPEPANRNVVLIGIRSSHHEKWTSQQPAPADPRLDGWIHVPGKLLIIFEFKNDEKPLDATQISAYGHRLGIFPADVPRPEAGCLLSLEQAHAVQRSCADLVLDAPWSAVVAGLDAIQKQERGGAVGRWLCGQASAYLQSHIRPSYAGPQTILDWLGGPDDGDRRHHLRILVKKMGDALAGATQEPGNITIGKDKSGEPKVEIGTISAVYVRVHQDQQPISREWLGKKCRLNLWFHFIKEAKLRMGMDFWVEATGAQPDLTRKDPVQAWNEASVRHTDVYAARFEEDVTAWSKSSSGKHVEVYSLRFKGKNRIWKGGGEYVDDGPKLRQATPEGALRFLQEKEAGIWQFPKVGPENKFKTIEEAQPLVRKPALALSVPLDVNALRECGEDAQKLQTVLKKAVANITASALTG